MLTRIVFLAMWKEQSGFFCFLLFSFFFFEHHMELTYPQIMTLYDHLSMKGSCLVLVFKKFSFLYP